MTKLPPKLISPSLIVKEPVMEELPRILNEPETSKEDVGCPAIPIPTFPL